jgi:hypothetical protein
MTKPDRLRRVKRLYHLTDSRNVASIRELGGLWSTARLKDMKVGFHSGGNQHGLDADKLFGMDQYVHLCFSKSHPMAHLAEKDGRIEKLQWLVIDDPDAIFKINGVRYCAEVSNKSGAEF